MTLRDKLKFWILLSSYVEMIVRGTSPISLPDAIANSLSYVKAFGGTELVAETYLDTATADGKCEQADVPTPDDPVDIVCNNGVLKWDSVNQTIYADGTVETVTDAQSNTATCEKLLSAGDYKDTQEILSGAITRNVVVKVLDGTENYVKDGSRYYLTVTDMLNEGNVRTANLLCSHFLASTTGAEGDCFKYSQQVYFYPNMTLYPDAAAFQQWLADQYAAGTPVIVVYPLATATTETVTGQPLTKEPLTVTGSLNNLVVNAVSTSHTVPTPTQPLDIVSNNGVLRIQGSATGTGTQADTPTPTEPIYPVFYQKGNLVLRAVGGYADTYDATTQTITRNVGVKVFDGTESWFAYNGGAGYQTTVQDMLSSTSGAYFCTHAIAVSSITSSGIRFGAGNKILYWCQINTTFTTLDIFKAWLADQYNAGTPVTVYYPLATPITESFTPSVYADGTVETIGIHGKNFFNKDDDTNWGGWYPSGGVIAYSTAANRTVVMRCQPNTTYYFKHCTYAGGLRAFYVEDETFEVGAPYAGNAGTVQGAANTVYSITTSANAKWLFVCFARTSGGSATVEEQASDYMLSTEVLTSDTPYEPYYNGGTATAEMLLKVDDYQDVQSIIDGVVTRNIGIKVFDGTENWSAGSAQNPNRFILAGAFNDIAQIPNENVGYANCYTVVARSSNIQSILQNNECGWNTTYVFCVRDDRFDTVAQFTAWLATQYAAGTPVIVVYPLATPTTESVTGQPMQVQQGDNFVEITQASLSGLELEAKYKRAA